MSSEWQLWGGQHDGRNMGMCKRGWRMGLLHMGISRVIDGDQRPRQREKQDKTNEKESGCCHLQLCGTGRGELSELEGSLGIMLINFSFPKIQRKSMSIQILLHLVNVHHRTSFIVINQVYAIRRLALNAD
jgi:hypothetical protein